MPGRVKRVPDPPPLEVLDAEGRIVVTATIRGTKYVLREVSAVDYETMLAQSKDDKGVSNDATLIKLMMGKSLIEPAGMTVSAVYDKGLGVAQTISRIVQDIHWRFERTDEEKAADEAERAAQEEDEDEGEVKAA